MYRNIQCKNVAKSGVGIQQKIICEALLDSGKYRIISLGCAIKHRSYDPVKTDKYGDDWITIPIDGFGNIELLRTIVRKEKVDAIQMFSDNRFFKWLFAKADEIQPLCPIIWNNIWDSDLSPFFNKVDYESMSKLVAISKVTYNNNVKVVPTVPCEYLPHAVNPKDFFKNENEEEVLNFKKQMIPEEYFGRTIFFWNNRNAERKLPGSLVEWFKTFLDRVGHDKAVLVLKTNPKDGNGPDLEEVLKFYELDKGQVFLIPNGNVPDGAMGMMYNAVDCTVNIAHSEGFGLSSLESLACGTPVINNMTGGLQEQVYNEEDDKWCGIGLVPVLRSMTGNQEVPYIYRDFVGKEDFIAALTKIHNMTKEERDELGANGIDHVEKHYNYESLKKNWVRIMDELIEKEGSWETRTPWERRWALKEM